MERGYNMKQAADLLGVSVRTARTWAGNGKMNAKKIAGTCRWIVLESEIKRLQGVPQNENAN